MQLDLIPIATSEAAPDLDDDELMLKMKVQYEVTRCNATRTNFEGDFLKMMWIFYNNGGNKMKNTS